MRNIGMAPVYFRNGSNSAFARSISAACAAVVCATRLGEQARQKRNIHGAILIAYRGGTDKGPSGSMIHLGAFLRIPGDASGRISLKAKAPALPADALAAGAVQHDNRQPSRLRGNRGGEPYDARSNNDHVCLSHQCTLSRDCGTATLTRQETS